MMAPFRAACPWVKRPIFWIIAVGLLLRLWSSSVNFQEMRWQNDARMSIPAARLLEGKGLSLEDDTGPSAYRPPLYILWLSGLYATFGTYATLGPSIAQSLVSTCNILLLYLLARRVWKREDAALASAALLAIHPYTTYHDAALYHTFFSTFLLLSATLFLIKGYEERNTLSLGISGALFGLCILIISVIVPFLGLLIASGLILWQLPWKKRATLVGSFILGLSLAWSPWIIRNALAFHAFIPLTTESGVTLWMGNNPESATRLPLRTHEASPVPLGTPFNLPKRYEGCLTANACRGGVSEQQENKELTRLAINWIKQHPREFARLTLWRFKGIWSPWLTPQKSVTADTLLNILIKYGYIFWNLLLASTAIVGLWYAWKKQVWFFPILSLGLALSSTGAYALFLYYTKYRIPFEAVLLPLSGLGLCVIWKKWSTVFSPK